MRWDSAFVGLWEPTTQGREDETTEDETILEQNQRRYVGIAQIQQEPMKKEKHFDGHKDVAENERLCERPRLHRRTAAGFPHIGFDEPPPRSTHHITANDQLRSAELERGG